ncbi:DMT family transporter, partial [Variovorax sp. KBW07]|uniref:DMT family transporter n=1 Tax=Variovorax sp. KBW07 TaxID=2153358 RepID=UPI0021A993FF
IVLASFLLGAPIRLLSITAALVGLCGVALMVLAPNAALDAAGIAAGFAGAASMACGTVLSRRWQPPVSLLTSTAWQLTAGGLLLVPVSLALDPVLPPLTANNLLGLAWLGLVGAALTYVLWFRGIARLDASVVSSLGFLSPLAAVVLGAVFLDQTLTPAQIAGLVLVICSIWFAQHAQAKSPSVEAIKAT